jgi:hypothetical protein
LVATFWGVLRMRASMEAKAPRGAEVASNAAPPQNEMGDAKWRSGDASGARLEEASGEKEAKDADEPAALGTPPAEDAPEKAQKRPEEIVRGELSRDDASTGGKDAGRSGDAGDEQDRRAGDEAPLKKLDDTRYGAPADAFAEAPIDEVVRDAATPAAALERLTARARQFANWKQTEETAGLGKKVEAPKEPPQAPAPTSAPTDEERRQEAARSPERRKSEKDAKLDDLEQAAAAPQTAEQPTVVFLTLSRDDPATQAWLRAHPDAAVEGAIVVVDVQKIDLEALRGAFAKPRYAEVPSTPLTPQQWLERAAAIAPPDREEVAKNKEATKPAAPAREPTGGGGTGGAKGPETRGKSVGATKRGAAPAADKAAAAVAPVRIVLLLEPAPEPAAGQK